ncbi:MAG: GNAT family N-acetyltransferase [Methyloceanibacter sp.]
MNSLVEVRRLNGADVQVMRDVVAMLPVPEWRDERVPGLGYLAEALDDPCVYVFAAFEDERPAGFVSAYRFPLLTRACQLAYIYDVYVAPGAQASGVGRMLMESVIAECRREGVQEAWVGPDLDTEAARRLFISNGATDGAQEYIQFEFDLGVSDGEDS